MPPHVVGPVQVQSPVDVPDLFGSSSRYQRQVGRRRIFVQTDGGDVLDVELDRADTAGKVKKVVQVALALPTEQSNLVFGGHIVEDLSEVRKDSPVLLTRGISRSCSSPCLSPSVQIQPSKDTGKPIEVVGGTNCCPQVKRLLREAVKALEAGVSPVPAKGGLGGAYYFRNRRGESIAIVKPTDEEPFAPNNPNGYVGRSLGQPGLKRTIRVGEAGVREVVAYLLDHNRFASVPFTALVKATHPVFNVNDDSVKGNRDGPPTKIGSLQQYVKHDFDASEHGTSQFPVSAVHRIGILDIRLFNTDRHSGNILVRKTLEDKAEAGVGWTSSKRYADDAVELIPIDHGFCLPETLEAAYFEWLHWPQASLPFSHEELEYIAALDVDSEVEMLRAELPMLREGCLRVLILSTTVLQRAAAAGFTLADIGSMLSRELRGMDEEASELETLCNLAKHQLEALRKSGEFPYGDADGPSDDFDTDDDYFTQEQFEFDMDQEDDRPSTLTMRDRHSGLSTRLFGTHLTMATSDAWDCGPLALQPAGFAGHGSAASSPVSIQPSTPSPFLQFDEAGPFSKDERSSTPSEDSSDLPFHMEEPSLASQYKSNPPQRTRSSHVGSTCRSLNFDRLSRMCSPQRPVQRVPNTPFSRSAHSICSRFYPSKASGFGPALSEEEEELRRAFPKDGALVFGEMCEQTWSVYLDIVKDLLDEALVRRRSMNNMSAKRFGTSCKF